MTTAREKLNGVAIRTALAIGAIVALVFQSIPLGFLASFLIFGASMASGDYRISPRKPGGVRRK